MSTIISLIATLVSSFALVGVAISLLLQSRQLRTSQLQASQTMHTELIKLGIGNPALTTIILGDFSPSESSVAALLNLNIMFLRSAYLLKTISADAVNLQAGRLFEAEYPRTWWAWGRDILRTEASTKREKDFFAIVDAKYEDAMGMFEGTDISAAESIDENEA